MITTLLGEMDESKLILKEGFWDDDDRTVNSIEYCMPGCDGSAHITGIPDAEGHFCNKHIHRGVHVTIKRGIAAMAEAGGING